MKDLSRLAMLIGLTLLVVAVAGFMQGFGWTMGGGSGVWIALLVIFLVSRRGGCCMRPCAPRAKAPS